MLEAAAVMRHLRRCGVVVHHAAPMPTSANEQGSIVVFLEATLGQFELARGCALRIPAVGGVTFAGFSPAIMYVHAGHTPRRTNTVGTCLTLASCANDPTGWVTAGL
jgi:hypothetical protein